MPFSIIPISENVDVITSGYTDFDSLSPEEKIKYLELEESFYVLNRSKKKIIRENKYKRIIKKFILSIMSRYL